MLKPETSKKITNRGDNRDGERGGSACTQHENASLAAVASEAEIPHETPECAQPNREEDSQTSVAPRAKKSRTMQCNFSEKIHRGNR